MATDHEILGRDDVNDLEAIIAITNTDVTEAIHTVEDNADAIFTWDYEKGSRPALNKLYEKAKSSQWNGETDLDWSIDVDPEKIVNELQGANAQGPFEWIVNHPDSPLKNFGEKEWTQVGVESMNWRLSQFMHGEQGALICTAKIVETVPWIDAKYYASTQVMDEARHVEVFAKYLQEKLTGFYPINAHLKMLLDDIVQDSRWDMTYLGMQIMVEGLALAAFGFMYQLTEEPLLKKLLRYVMSDEARHVAFGVLSLKEYYAELSDVEMRERQEFAFEAAVRMRDRFLQQEVWERMGVDGRKMVKLLLDTPPDQQIFQQMLFSKIVPNCKKLGLLDASDQWLRHRFEEIGVIQFEDWADTGEEYLTFDAVTEDREAASARKVRPMGYTCFDVSESDHVAHVQLNRPDKLNSMVPEFWMELPEIIKGISAEGSARAIVLSSTGKHFSAGMDLAVFTGGSDVAAGGDGEKKRSAEAGRQRARLRETALMLQDSFTALEKARMPVIAAIQGGCIGGAVDMVTACDLRYVTADAFFVIQEINIGMTADVGTLQRLPKLVPDAIVRELAYLGGRMPAQRAYEVGLVNGVYDTHDELVAGALAVAAQIAAKSPLAIWGSKEMITYARDHSVADSLNYIATWQTGMFQPADMMESFSAKADQRDPDFDDLLPSPEGF